MSTQQGRLTSDRNQKILLELATQPGNNICADCKSRNPRWASANLGIFICVNCASIHRGIGTHITKVKSLTMDDWTKEQVDHMRSLGNIKSNAIYNPNELRHPPPPNLEDADRDSEIEQYIRAKYQYKKFLDKSALVASKLGPSRSAASVASRSATQPLAATAAAPRPTPPQPSSSAAPPSTQPANKSSPFPTRYPSASTQHANPLRSSSQPIPPQPRTQQSSGGVWDDLSSLSNAPSQNSSLPLQYQSSGINPYAQQNPGFNPFAQQQATGSFNMTQQQFLGGSSPASVTSHMASHSPSATFYQPQPQGSLQASGSMGQTFLSPSPSLLSAGTGGQFLSPSPSQQQQFLSPSPSQQFLSLSPSQQFLSPSPSQQFLSPSPSQQFLSASPSQQFTGMGGNSGSTGQFLGMTSMQMQQQLMLQQQAEQQRQQQMQMQQQQMQQQQQQQMQQLQQLQQQQLQHQQQQAGMFQQQQLPSAMFAPPPPPQQQQMFNANQMYPGGAGFGAPGGGTGQWGAM